MEKSTKEKLQALTGILNNTASTYARGETIRLYFQSDNLIQRWGFRIDKIQYID